MGFIELASSVTHVWYVKGRPSKIALIFICILFDSFEIASARSSGLTGSPSTELT